MGFLPIERVDLRCCSSVLGVIKHPRPLYGNSASLLLWFFFFSFPLVPDPALLFFCLHLFSYLFFTTKTPIHSYDSQSNAFH